MTNATLESPIPVNEDDVGLFLQEIRRYPLLTAQQERELAMACARGEQEAITQMVNCNLRLVVSVAREYAGLGVPLLDLIQEGSIGLLAAAKKFDYTREFRFSTYASDWIRQGMTRYLTEHAGLVRIPSYTAERIRRVRTAQAELLVQLGREPTRAELARHTGLEEEKVSRYLSIDREISSLDAPVGDEEEGTVGMLIEDTQALSPQEELVRKELKRTLDTLLSTLSPRQRQVLSLHFGLENGTVYSLEEISKMLGVSKERARQIEQQAMRQLQRKGVSLGLEDFLE